MKPHQEETEIVNLGVGEEKKEVKVGTGMTTLSEMNWWLCYEITKTS